jgi:hypothetical protein
LNVGTAAESREARGPHRPAGPAAGHAPVSTLIRPPATRSTTVPSRSVR